MKLPIQIEKTESNLNKVAKEMKGSEKNYTQEGYNIDFLEKRDVFIVAKNQKGFEEWKASDYATNLSEAPHDHQPYAIETENYFIVHDYC